MINNGDIITDHQHSVENNDNIITNHRRIRGRKLLTLSLIVAISRHIYSWKRVYYYTII